MSDRLPIDDVLWYCNLGCLEPVAGGVRAVVDHLRLFHPAEYGDGPERWPDGGFVIHDETLTPADFAEETQDGP